MFARLKWSTICALAAGCVIAMCSPASAAITYYFNQANAGLGLPDGFNYGSVEIKAGAADGLAAGTVTFTLTVNPARPGDLVGSFYFNTSLSLSPGQITSNIADWNPAADAEQADGFGNFDWGLGGQNATRVSTAVITVTGLAAGQDNTANFAFLSTGGAGEGQAYFASHLFPGGGGATGYMGSTTTTPPPERDPPPGLPEPTSLAIWALGMVAAGIGARRMRKAK